MCCVHATANDVGVCYANDAARKCTDIGAGPGTDVELRMFRFVVAASVADDRSHHSGADI